MSSQKVSSRNVFVEDVANARIVHSHKLSEVGVDPNPAQEIKEWDGMMIWDSLADQGALHIKCLQQLLLPFSSLLFCHFSLTHW